MTIRMEQRTLNTWPSLQTILHHGWLLRNSEGYTKRANSVSPLYMDDDVAVEKLIADCEQYYSMHKQDPIFKITPYTKPENLDELLDHRGYRVVDPSILMTRSLVDLVQPQYKAVVSNSVTQEWLNCVSEFYGTSSHHLSILGRMLERSTLTKGFFVLKLEGKSIACGVGIIDDGHAGLYDIATSPSYRNRGFGKQLILNMLEWARQQGARHSFLQVVANNSPAVQLYQGLGYQELYRYWYRVKDSLC